MLFSYHCDILYLPLVRKFNTLAYEEYTSPEYFEILEILEFQDRYMKVKVQSSLNELCHLNIYFMGGENIFYRNTEFTRIYINKILY